MQPRLGDYKLPRGAENIRDMTVLIRADASTAIGTGHVMRCLTLAEFLRKEGVTVEFIMRPMPGSLDRFVEQRGFDVHRLEAVASVPVGPKDTDDYQAWLGVSIERDAAECSDYLRQSGQHVDWLVVDHYGLDESWERAMLPVVGSLLVIDDLANRHHACEVLLDTNFGGRSERRYTGLVPDYCRMLLGPAYALLRAEFREERRLLRRGNGEVCRVMLFFGGVDRPNMTQRALDGVIAAVDNSVEIEVIVGSVNPHVRELSEFCNNHAQVTLACNVADMSRRMARADMSIGAAGTTTWERCALGLPSVVVALAENQEAIGREAERTGVARYLGHYRNVTSEDVELAVEELVSSPSKLSEMSRSALALVDGRGVERVAACIMSRKIEGVAS